MIPSHLGDESERDLVVAAKEVAADGVVSLVLHHPEGAPLPEWSAGAHVDLELTTALVRQYSLCGDCADRTSWRVSVLREPAGRGGSEYIHERLEAGATVRVRGPRNHFRLLPSPRYVFIAGGIGVTPLLPMVAAAQASGVDWQLLYGGRSRSSMAFLDELAQYGERVQICPQDEFGLLDLAAALPEPRTDTLVYYCGPEPLLAAVEAQGADWPSGALQVERFAPKSVGDPARAESFEVVLERSGKTLQIPPERSILSVIEDAGVAVLSSCTEGTCGTCETGVLEGTPDHRDSVLTEADREENDVMMICVSRSCSNRLVLDL